MAINYFNVSVVSRSSGSGSAVAAAAYRHNTRMKSEYDGKTYSYNAKDDLVHSEITLPEHAPEWAREAFGDIALAGELDGREATNEVRNAAIAKLSAVLWNGVEQYEIRNNRRHKEARLARKFIFALPANLTRENQIDLAREFVRKSFAARGMVADWVIHDPKGKEHDNPHVHVMASMRNLGKDDWGNKNRDWNARDLLATWRAEWATYANIALERAGFDERIDHRSYADQGIDLEPVSYDPHVAAQAEAAGQVARNKTRTEAARVRNEAFLRANPEHILVVVGAERSVFDKKDIEEAFQKRLGEDALGIDELVADAMSSSNIVMASDGKGFSTKAQVSLEANLQVDALQLHSERLAIGEDETLPAGVGVGLTDDQMEALKDMISDRRLSLITGYAGAGKTRTIGEAAKVWEARGFEVLGGAVSGRATQELADIEGLTAASLAAWEARWSRGRLPAQGKFVFFMDEAGMVGASHWERVQRKIAEMGGKLIPVGDSEQLQPVLDTSAFGMVMGHVGATAIHTVMRMANLLERMATTQFAQGEAGAKSALKYYEDAGHIKHVGDGVAALADDYYEVEPEKSRVAIAYSNRDVWALNAAVRQKAIDLGFVDADDQINYGVIRRIDRSGLHPRIVTAPMLFAKNDRVLFSKPHRELGLPKSTFATILAVRQGEIDLLIDGDKRREVTIDMSAFRGFDYGYAATGHCLQGVSMAYVFALAHARMNRHAAYVFMSRHIKAVTMYVIPKRFKEISFEEVATQSGYQNATGALADERDLVRSSPSVADMSIAERQDYAADSVTVRDGVLLEDAHLSSVFRHHYGLLASEYVPLSVSATHSPVGSGDVTPMFGDDPRGFVENPQSVVNHLVKHSSTFHASDIAGALMEVVFDPDSFARLFEGAMAHPDLVVLSEDGVNGEGRVYSTGAQVKTELEALDIGVALATGSQDQQLEVGAGYVSSALAQNDVEASVADAVHYGAAGGQLHLITGGSGSGKTTALGLIAKAHDYAGFDVVSIAPTRATAKVFSQNAGISAQTFGSLVYGLDHGTKHLDANSVIVLDHAELMGAEDTVKLLKLVELTGAKLVAGRGDGALTSIAAGQVFADIEDRIGAFELSGSLRQEDAALRDMVTGLKVKAGRARDVELVDTMMSRDLVDAKGSRIEAIEAVARAYVNDPSLNKVAIGYSRVDVDALNGAIHAQMHPDVVNEAGAIVDPIETESPSGLKLNDLKLGDKLVLLERYAPAGLGAGEQALVVDANSADVTLRMGALEEERFVKIARDDAELDVGHGFAQTLYSANGAGQSSVHVLGSSGFTRDALHAALGLHEDKVSLVLPVEKDVARDYLLGILNKEARVATVANYVTDAARILSQVCARATALSETARGVDNIYGKPEQAALLPSQSVTATYLNENPEHILTLIGAERTVFGLADLEAAFEARLQEGVADIQPLMDKVLAHPALVALDDFGRGGHRLYTTRANVVQEINLIEQVRALKNTSFTDPSGFAPITMPEHLGDEQRDAVEAMLSDDPITLVTGYAGAGKTTAIAQAAKIWKERGFDVFGSALSGRVTQELSSVEGMELASLAAWEARWARGRRPEAGKFVFFMDEAAMVGPDIWARVQDRVLKMGGKLIAVGDPEQLQPISAGNAFKAIEAEVGSTVIQEVRRQQNPEERRFTTMLAHGGAEAVAAIQGYAARGSIVFLDDEAACIAALSKDYCERGGTNDSRTIIAYTNRDVHLLNEQVHQDRLTLGLIDPLSVQNYGLIERVDRSTGVARRETAALLLGRGDRVIFKQAHADLRIPKSAFADVIATRPGEVDLMIDGDVPRQVTIDMNRFNHFDYGFASTIHNAQSISKAYSGAMAHGYMDRHGLYVTLSRHVISTKFYVPRTRIENMATLERLVQRNSYQSLAVSEVQGRVQESSVPGLSSLDVGGRADWVPDTQTDFSISFEGDALLASIVNRMTGLLASNYRDGDPVFGEDPSGYVETPEKIIDDLILRQSTLRATDVARVLSGVVKEPDHYARLYAQAMSHPDLVVLSEEGDQGEGRIYSTKAQVALELNVIDRGARLALLPRDKALEIHSFLLGNMKNRHTLSEEQATALEASTQDPLTIISGPSGSGKTHLACALADAHMHSNRQVIMVSSTGVGADNLREGKHEAQVMTLTGLEYAIKDERIKLDKNTVVILDEASLLGAKSADGLFKHIERSGANLVAFRDNDQMGPYEAAPVFRTLEARIGGIELGTQHRSQNPELEKALGQINAKGADASVTAKRLNTLGVLAAGGTRDASIKQVAENYASDPNQDKIIVAHSRADVATLNKSARDALDAKRPERMEGHSETAEVGSVSDLRLGDRVVVASYYKAARLRPGTRLEVVRKDKRGNVVLTLGSGSEAQFVKLKKDDAEFDYNFGFATTLQGSKGRSIGSVHMLGTPGMSKNDFYTGAALHKHSLKVVMATSEDHKEVALTAILQTDGTARSALDYGFDASGHARAALKDHVPDAEKDMGFMTSGVNRILDWVADSLDGGAGSKTPARDTQLRASVVAELMASRSRHGTSDLSLFERKALEKFVDELIKERTWHKMLSQVGWRDRMGHKEHGKGGVTGPSMVDRILSRGALVAKTHKVGGLQDLFEATQKDIHQRQMDGARVVSVEKEGGVEKAVQVTFKHAPDSYLGKVERRAAERKERERQGEKTVEVKFKHAPDSYLGKVERRAAERKAQEVIKHGKSPEKEKPIDKSISIDKDDGGFGY